MPVGLPTDLTLAAFFLLLAVLAAFAGRRIPRRGIERCLGCGYTLVTPLPKLCPECGGDFRELHRDEVERRVRQAAAAPRVLGFVACMFVIPGALEQLPLPVRERFRIDGILPESNVSIVVLGHAWVRAGDHAPISVESVAPARMFVESNAGKQLELVFAGGRWREAGGGDPLDPDDAARRLFRGSDDARQENRVGTGDHEAARSVSASILAIGREPTAASAALKATQLSDHRGWIHRLLAIVIALGGGWLTGWLLRAKADRGPRSASL